MVFIEDKSCFSKTSGGISLHCQVADCAVWFSHSAKLKMMGQHCRVYRFKNSKSVF